MKTLVFAVIVAFAVLTHAYAVEKVPRHLSASQGAQYLAQLVESAQHGPMDRKVVLDFGQKSTSANGDFVILWGLGAKDEAMTKKEYEQMWRIMNYVAGKKFRVIMNVQADIATVRDAVETEGTSVILYSGHGNTSGFYDHFSMRIPYDIFANKAKSLYQFLLSACYGTESRVNYAVPADMTMLTWSGLTTTEHLMNYLVGPNWTGMEGKDLAPRK